MSPRMEKAPPREVEVSSVSTCRLLCADFNLAPVVFQSIQGGLCALNVEVGTRPATIVRLGANFFQYKGDALPLNTCPAVSVSVSAGGRPFEHSIWIRIHTAVDAS